MNGSTFPNCFQKHEASFMLEEISKKTKILLDYLASKQLPEPSFDDGDSLNSMQKLPDDIEAAREAAIEATDELHHLLLGPLGLLLEAPGDQYLLLGLQYAYRYRIADKVPLEGETTFTEIAEACKLSTSDVTRFIRCLVARHVFKEVRKGVIVQTAASRLLIDNPMVEAWIMNVAEEFWPALTRMVDATEKWPMSEEPNESGYSLSHDTSESPFDVIKRDTRKQKQFIDAMSFSHMHPSYHMRHLVDNVNFGRGTIVDIGGSHGQVSIAIARKNPEVCCIVQDLPETIAGLHEHIPAELEGRIVGMEHDFLKPQPIQGADIYLLRWILHDWSDKYCVQILKSLVPGLKRGSRIIVNDICIPEPGQLCQRADRSLRLMDISMKAFNNARERDAETWEWLFATADSRYSFKGISMPAEARMAIITVEWTG